MRALRRTLPALERVGRIHATLRTTTLAKQGYFTLREVELKLDLSDAGADALEASDLLAAPHEVRSLSAVYHDTADHALAKAGLSLRIRTSGAERIQTVKADGEGAAGLFVRSEWEQPVEGDVPTLDDSIPIKVLLGERTSEIGPIFSVNVERRIWIIEEAGAKIECVLDRGEVVCGTRKEPICEAELELQAGSATALFVLARKLDAIAAVRLGVLTKAERGYRLTAAARQAFKAERVSLTPDMSAARAFQAIAQACIRQFRLNEAILLHDRHAEALHQARVALRRLRSAFSIFKRLVATDPRAIAILDDLRWLAAELGEARNLDVLLDKAAPGALHTQLQQARDVAYAKVEAAIASPRVRGLMLDLAEWLANGDWLTSTMTQEHRDEPVRDFAARALRRFRRQVKKQGRDLKAIDDDARHELRKSAKKLRYASEFFGALFDAKRQRRRYKHFSKALENLQDRLGALNDMATAPDVLTRLGVAGDPEAQALLDGRKRKSLIATAADDHADLIDARRFWS